MNPIYLSTEDHTVLSALASSLSKSNSGSAAKLSAELARAVVVDRRALPDRIVRLGTSVEIEDLESGERDRYTLCLPWQADAAQGRLSVLAPIGTGILGYGENDVLEWQTPGGLRRLRIRSVRQPAFVQSV